MTNKTVVIHQPDFLPYIGFFHRLTKCDLFVILDNAQFVSGTSKSWQNRDIIKTPNGKKWLTISVQRCPLGTSINEVLLSKSIPWKRNNLNQLKSGYKKAPFYEEIFPYIEELYAYDCEKLIDFNLKSIEMLMRLLNIRVETMLASTLNPQGTSNLLLVDILKKVGATTYLSGIGAKDYFDAKPFENAGINVIWQDFEHPVYPQLYGDFTPYLSTIDLLFNCGIEQSREIIYNLR